MRRAGRAGCQTQPPGPGVTPVGAVGVRKAVAGSGGLGKLESGLKGVMQPVVASLKFNASVATSSGLHVLSLDCNVLISSNILENTVQDIKTCCVQCSVENLVSSLTLHCIPSFQLYC